MKVTVKYWHQSFDMNALEPIVRYHEKSFDIDLKPAISEKMMKIAIEGEKDFDEEMKKVLSLDDWRDVYKIKEKTAKIVGDANRVYLSFQPIPAYVYVYRNFIGESKLFKDRYNKFFRDGFFTTEDDLEAI